MARRGCGIRLGLQRTAVPGGAVRHRDAVPAPRIRGVRAHDSAADQPVPGRPHVHQPGDLGRVRAHGVSPRPLDAARARGTHQCQRSGQRRQTVRRVPCPSEVQRERTRREQLDGRQGGRRNRARPVAGGRQRARRVRDRIGAQPVARPAARPAGDQHRARPQRRHPVVEQARRQFFAATQRRGVEAVPHWSSSAST